LAKYLIRRRRPAGTLIAEFVIPLDIVIEGKRMGGDGHYNLFADRRRCSGAIDGSLLT
jgi:hypothetical protein